MQDQTGLGCIHRTFKARLIMPFSPKFFIFLTIFFANFAFTQTAEDLAYLDLLPESQAQSIAEKLGVQTGKPINDEVKVQTFDSPSFDKTLQVTKDDKRLLKIGKIIRNYSIDELPQFFNVLNGDMSIVGPRPHMVEHDIHYSSLFNNFLKRHKCNPGLTGWAQVNGLRGATPNPDVMKRRMEYDLWYLNNWSIFLDIYIIFKTFYALFKYKGD